MAKKKNKKIIRYRRPPNINVGMIVFAIIFLYLLFSVSTYLRRDKIQFYEVAEGGIVNDKIYTGLILREEQVKSADSSGYINYYLPEGKRASVGTRIYSLDETGNLQDLLKQEGEEGHTLSEEGLSDLKKQLSNLALSLTDEEFSELYDARYSLESAVLEYSSFNALDQLDQLASESGVSFAQVRSDVSGVVSYGIDGYEGLTANDLSADRFDRSAYKKTVTKSGELIESGSPAYKVATSENWSLFFPLSEEDVSLYADRQSLTVSFRGHSLETTAAYSTVTGSDGAAYGRLDFSKYMEQFISDRFVEFEVKLSKEEGLKIPVTSVTEKNFYVIPLEYITKGGDSSDLGFNKEVYGPDGSSVVFVPATIYYSDEEYYYVDMGESGSFAGGDYVIKPESSDRFQIGQTASLKGVYNINKGYTVFKQIDILDSNSEYYTVRKGTSYGLSVYDHIVLDASKVEEGQLLYQ